MPKGIYERKPKEDQMEPEKTDAEQMFPVLLAKNYQPAGAYEVVGWHKPAVSRKNPVGQWVEVEKAEFIRGEMKPAERPGTGFAGKVWAGTVIKLPIEEAKTIIGKRIAERADALP